MEHRYQVNGGQILSEAWVQNGTEYRMHFLYDETGAPMMIQFRHELMEANAFYTYFLEKNLQGDIVAVYNEYGEKIGTYSYDAWGNVTPSFIGTDQSFDRAIVLNFNPFKYRGYYYDQEIGFYYLQSRYYNPTWGRFLNTDGYVSTGQGLLGYNMFAYCGNNPVMFVDYTGYAMEESVDLDGDGKIDYYHYTYTYTEKILFFYLVYTGNVYIYVNKDKNYPESRENCPEKFAPAMDIIILYLPGDNPNMYAYRADRLFEKFRRSVVKCMLEFDEEFNLPWERTESSLMLEWQEHMRYKIAKSARNIDFDNAEEGKGRLYYLDKAVRRFLNICKNLLK